MAIPASLLPRSWTDFLSGGLFKLVLMALAFAAASLLLRNALAIGAHVPLDPNEGWNAYLARAALNGGPLYPRDALMINNYPPLSFYVVGALSRITGDPIVAGRLLSLISFLALGGFIIVILRDMGADVLAALFASLFFAVGLLAASDYVAMDDPELLGHALQLAGLSLLLPPRRNAMIAALLMTAGLFVKHNLLALPLAAALWLLGEDRKEALRFAAAGLLLSLGGIAATRLLLGVNLFAALASPRRLAGANFIMAMSGFLSWAGAGLLVTAGVGLNGRNAGARLAGLYAGIALLLGGFFSLGDGVDANIFFDTAIALSLGAGLALERDPALVHLPRRWAGLLALAVAAPQAVYLQHHYKEANFSYTEAFAREAPLDIGFIAVHPGPSLCQDLTLCFWAGKDEPVDVFNLSEAYVTGARSESELARKIESQYFGSIVLTDLAAFGPRMKSVILAHYRVAHQDDNGAFLERVISRNRPP
jgi:hypothetical protein